MTEGRRECGCPPEVARCHHELAEVADTAAQNLTLDELERLERRIKRMQGPRPEERERDLPLPHSIDVVQGGTPEGGKRS